MKTISRTNCAHQAGRADPAHRARLRDMQAVLSLLGVVLSQLSLVRHIQMNFLP